MAKAYGGELAPSQGKKRSKKFPKSFKLKQNVDLLGLDEPQDDKSEPPLTDRLYPSLMRREEERVRKMAKVAYRQGLDENGESADGVGFQAFFKKQLDEMQQNRQLAKDEFQKNQALYDQQIMPYDPERNFQIETQIQESSPFKELEREASPMRESSNSTNKAGSSLWGQAAVGVVSSLRMGSNLNQSSLPELQEDEAENRQENITTTQPDDDAETLHNENYQQIQQEVFQKSSSSALTTFKNLGF